jgi:hypothetical protein
MKKEKIKNVDLKKVDEKNYTLDFFSKGYNIRVEADEAVCYRLFRQIKKELKLK